MLFANQRKVTLSMAEVSHDSSGALALYNRPDTWSGDYPVIPDVIELPEPTAEVAAQTAGAVTEIDNGARSTPEPSPTRSPEPVRDEPTERNGVLTEAETMGILDSAGFSGGLLYEALSVSFCESGYVDPVTKIKYWNPSAIGDSGRSVGLFQLNKATWFRYAGTNPDLWSDALTNAITARATYQYDIDRGYGAWHQWTCKPH